MGLFNIFKSLKDENKEKYDTNYESFDEKEKNDFFGEDRYTKNDDFDNFYNEGFCMEIDDIFTITGRGTVVTGQVEHGDIYLNDVVKIQRNGQIILETQVVGIEMFRKMLNYAKVGDNVGVLLRGVSKDVLRRGDKLIK